MPLPLQHLALACGKKKRRADTHKTKKDARVQAHGTVARYSVLGTKHGPVLCGARWFSRRAPASPGGAPKKKLLGLTFCAPADDRRTSLKDAEKLRSKRLRRTALALLSARGSLAAVALGSSGLPHHAYLAVEQGQSVSGLALGVRFLSSTRL